MKLEQIANSQTALKNLLEVKLPVKIAYKISKLVNRINPELQIYEEQRIKLIKSLGTETDSTTGTWSVAPENLAKYQEELRKLLDIEVAVDFGDGKELEKIKVEDLGDISLPTSDLINLNWLIE